MRFLPGSGRPGRRHSRMMFGSIGLPVHPRRVRRQPEDPLPIAYDGAVGKYGSIAVTERLISTTKRPLRLLLLLPLGRDAFRREVGCVSQWYNQHRPHSSLDGQTPNEK